MSVVIVSGATGFVGSALVRVLQENGDEVHAIVRASSDRGLAGGGEVRWHTGDMSDSASLDRAAEAARERADELGVACLAVHGAAVISYRTGDRELQQRVNVEGTRAFLAACRKVGVTRVVHVSSVVAVGVAESATSVVDEQAVYNAELGACDYTDTKREAELIALSDHGDMNVVVVNPGAIYGPARVLSNTSRFLETLRLHPAVGRVAPPGSLSCVGVSDVADGILLALQKGVAGRRYLLTESNLRLSELYERVASFHGQRRQTRVVPPFLWRMFVAASRGLDRVKSAEFATPQALNLLGTHFRFSSDRARSELGWRPTPFAEVLQETLVWLKSR